MKSHRILVIGRPYHHDRSLLHRLQKHENRTQVFCMRFFDLHDYVYLFRA